MLNRAINRMNSKAAGPIKIVFELISAAGPSDVTMIKKN